MPHENQFKERETKITFVNWPYLKELSKKKNNKGKYRYKRQRLRKRIKYSFSFHAGLLKWTEMIYESQDTVGLRIDFTYIHKQFTFNDKSKGEKERKDYQL